VSAAVTYLVLAIVAVLLAVLVFWLRGRRSRSPLRSVEHFRQTLQALEPEERHKG
jgi:hypothetical protein